MVSFTLIIEHSQSTSMSAKPSKISSLKDDYEKITLVPEGIPSPLIIATPLNFAATCTKTALFYVLHRPFYLLFF